MKLTEVLQDIGRPVAYYPKLAQAFGGVKEAIFLCQMLYWYGKQKDKDGWIYKTQEEIKEETGLSRYEQENARKNLRRLGILQEKFKGIPRRLYFKINLDKVNELWIEFLASKSECGKPTYNNAENQHTRMLETHIQESGKPTYKNAENQHAITENTNNEITNKGDYHSEITNPTHHPLKSGENSSSIRKNAKGYTLEDKKGFFGQGQSYINEVATIVANKLADVLGSIYNVKYSDKIINGWKKSIYTFLKNHEGIEVERLLDVIEWYGKHYNEQYIPKITDAKTFCNKFFALESSYLKRLKSKVGIRNVDLDGV